LARSFRIAAPLGDEVANDRKRTKGIFSSTPVASARRTLSEPKIPPIMFGKYWWEMSLLSRRGATQENQTMRCLPTAVVAVLALTSGALAQPASPSPVRSEVTQDDIVRQHPNWFSEDRIRYKPCPCSVIFPNGRHACIGLP
jgi:hypothetical protein